MSNLAAGICFHRASEEVQPDEAWVAVGVPVLPRGVGLS